MGTLFLFAQTIRKYFVHTYDYKFMCGRYLNLRAMKSGCAVN